MDEFSEKYYSKWRDEDVVGLIPELADFFKKPEDFDAEGFNFFEFLIDWDIDLMIIFIQFFLSS